MVESFHVFCGRDRPQGVDVPAYALAGAQGGGMVEPGASFDPESGVRLGRVRQAETASARSARAGAQGHVQLSERVGGGQNRRIVE